MILLKQSIKVIAIKGENCDYENISYPSALLDHLKGHSFNVQHLVTGQNVRAYVQAGLPLSFLNWAYVRQGVYFWAYGPITIILNFENSRWRSAAILKMVLSLELNRESSDFGAIYVQPQVTLPSPRTVT